MTIEEDRPGLARARRPGSARAAGWIPEGVFALGVAALLAAITLSLATNGPLPFRGATLVVGIVCAVVVRRLRPGDLLSALFLLSSGVGAIAALLEHLLQRAATPTAVAWGNLFLLQLFLIDVVVVFHAVAFFPDGHPGTRRQAQLARAYLVVLLLPVLVTLSSPIVPTERYLEAAATSNPLHVLPWRLSYDTGQLLIGLGWLSLLTAPLILLARYQSSTAETRRRIRWLLPPFVFLCVVLLSNMLLPSQASIIGWVSLLAVQTLGPLAFTLAVLDPQRLDVDRVLRRTLVYGALWLAIASTYVGVAAAVGLTAGRHLSVRWAVVIALLAATVFQPARAGLERVADRWVFGRRIDTTRVISDLGATLADTPDLQSLLPRMARALEDGLGLEWARVRLRATTAHPLADLSVPIVLDGEELGVVECGPKHVGQWNPEDQTVVATFAGQAALAVRNVRLTEDLALHAAEITASRKRLVESQEKERRRIERNIHDGVQQELVALIGQTGLAQHRLRRGRVPALDDLVAEISAIQSGLQSMLDNLRALASGVHPPILTDHGLVAAVDALATRHPLPVQLAIDPSLEGVRLHPAVEGAAYFVVAESLANSLKHADASSVSIELRRANGSLITRIADNGVGFSPPPPPDGGLASLDERLRALGGELSVTSADGRGTTVAAWFDMPSGRSP